MEITGNHDKFKFVKELKSDTKVRAVHFKIDKDSYHVCVADHGRMGWYITGFKANRSGLPMKNTPYLFTQIAPESNRERKAMDEDLQAGVNKLLEILNG